MKITPTPSIVLAVVVLSMAFIVDVRSVDGVRSVDAGEAAPRRMQGNWEIALDPPGKPRRVIGYFGFQCDPARAFTSDGKPGVGRGVEGEFAGDVFRGETLGGLSPQPQWWMERFAVRLSPDGTKASGTWFNGYETFPTSWRRLGPQELRLRAITPTAAGVRLEVTGSKIFYYQRHYFAQCGDVSVSGAGMSVTAKTPHPEAEAVTIDVAVAPGTPAGRRVLSFDGTQLPWQWQGTGTLRLTYNGKIRDRVGQNTSGLKADGAHDGTFTATLEAPGGRTVTALTLRSDTPGAWDTNGASVFWALGVAFTPDGPLLNNPTTIAVSLPVADRGSFVVFASDGLGEQFAPGRTVTLMATFADGSTATASTKISARPALPPDGLVTSRGSDKLSPIPDAQVRRDCTCQNIALARVRQRDLQSVSRQWRPPWGHDIVYGPFTTVYDLDDPALPPQAGSPWFSKRNPRDQVWFYFTYPEALAYATQARDHPCDVNIVVDYPDTSSNAGRRQERHRPFVGQGMGPGSSVGTNAVTITGSTVPSGTIGPGQASVEWSVQGRSCGTVRFAVDEK